MKRAGQVMSGVATGLAVIAFLALVAAVVRPALAQQPAGGGLVTCRADVKQFCAGVDPGAGRRVKCLADNLAKLSPACAEVVRARAAPQAGAPAAPAPAAAPSPAPATPAGPAPAAADRPMQACRQDLAALCGSVAAGDGRRAACLKEQRAKVSPACGAALDAQAKRRQDLRSACGDDVRRLCRNEKGPERRACLEKNATALSPACQEAVAALPVKK